MGKCCDSPAASLKRRVTIQNPVLVADGQGGFTEIWVDAAQAWCSIEPLKAWERFQAAQSQTPVTHKITMRFTRTVTSASRLKYGTSYFGVKEVINANLDNRFLAIKAVERVEIAYEADIGAILLRNGGFLLLRNGGNILLRA